MVGQSKNEFFKGQLNHIFYRNLRQYFFSIFLEKAMYKFFLPKPIDIKHLAIKLHVKACDI